MLCGLCFEPILNSDEPHWSGHEDGCGWDTRGWCYRSLLSFHAACCDCSDEQCLPSVPVQIRGRAGGVLPELLASEEAG